MSLLLLCVISEGEAEHDVGVPVFHRKLRCGAGALLSRLAPPVLRQGPKESKLLLLPQRLLLLLYAAVVTVVVVVLVR